MSTYTGVTNFQKSVFGSPCTQTPKRKRDRVAAS